jgi:hypothetical protein
MPLRRNWKQAAETHDGGCRRICVANRRVALHYDSRMHTRFAILGILLLAGAAPTAAAEPGPYARIAVLRPHDGDTVDFEAGYIRHLDWHKQAGDTWTWYGWNVTYGDRQRWFIYATFGHAAGDFDNPVAPAEDERDNVLNVTPHAQFIGNALYEFLPELSRGSAEPQATPRLEMTTVELAPGAAAAFERALRSRQSKLQHETLWYRMVAGGTAPRYVRLRSQSSYAALAAAASEQALPDELNALVAKQTIEILTLRPTMSYRLAPARQ